MSNFKELQSTFESKVAAMKKELQAGFNGYVKELFDACPELNAIQWRQYAPYFNDGEECIFGVYPAAFTNQPNFDDCQWGEYDGEVENAWIDDDDYGDFNPELIPVGYAPYFKDFSKSIQSDSLEDIMRTMFGNHVVITATREGFSIEEYDHD